MNGIRSRSALIGAASLLLALGLAAAAGAGPGQTGQEGGTLVVGMAAGEPDALDPTLARTFSGREVFLTFCEKLYDLERQGADRAAARHCAADDLEGQAHADTFPCARGSSSTTARRSTRRPS